MDDINQISLTYVKNQGEIGPKRHFRETNVMEFGLLEASEYGDRIVRIKMTFECLFGGEILGHLCR